MPEQRSWRGPRKKERPLELDKLVADLDQSQAEGPRIIVFEMDRRSLAEAHRLLGELVQRWKLREKRVLVVDAHPADPFIKFEGAPTEGFGEMLHYGLSPESVQVEFPGLPAAFIGAGGMGDLQPADPAEPARTLRRLAAFADRVILLVDSRDGEGLLEKLIDESAFRLRLSDPELDEHLERLAARRSAGRMRMLFILGIPLLVALIYMLLPDEENGEELRLEAPPPTSHRVRTLPEEEELPYFGGGEPRVAVADSPEVEIEAATIEAETVPVDSLADSQDDSQVEIPADTLLQAEVETPEAPKPAPTVAQRRGESRSAWNSALDHMGSFHVHVSSFRDSARAHLAQEREGFGTLPFRLQPVEVQGRTWYRVLVGEFHDLSAAVAFRDSLLDQAGRDFCVIGIDPEP